MSLQFEGSQTEQTTWLQKERFVKLEAVVQDGLFAWRESALALQEIKRDRLYRLSNYSTFAEYVKVKWHMARSYAYQLIDAAELAEEIEKMSTVVDISNNPSTIIPENPKVFQPLYPLPKEERAAAYQLVVEQNGGQIPTSSQVAESVAHATSERIGRLDTDRTAKPQPQAAVPKFPGRTFRLHEFRYDPQGDRVYVKVFKPANPFKGYEAKSENLSISFSDFVWEVGQMGFTLNRDGETTPVSREEEPLPSLLDGRDLSQVRRKEHPNVAAEALDKMLPAEEDDAQ